MTDEWNPPEDHPLSLVDAKRLLGGELGDVYRGVLKSCCTPLFWFVADRRDSSILNNGTLTVIETSERLLGVTAAHVIRRYLADKGNRLIHLQLMNAAVDELDIIDISDRLDVATLSLSSELIGKVGKELKPLKYWPPRPPQEGRGIMLAGYPGTDRLVSRPLEVDWGLFTSIGIARRVTLEQITWVIERDFGVPSGSIPELPPGHQLGGNSGGPLIAFFETDFHLSYYALAGIISQANESLENVIAKRADYIRPDGSIVRLRD